MSSIMFQNNSDCSCNSCSTQQKYFEIAKNFKELTTEVQKAQARRNLGISDECSLKWGNIKGFIEKQKDLTQYLNNYKSALGKKLDKHISDTNNPHNITKTQVGLSNVTNDAQVKRSEMGVAGGVATLDDDGKVPALQLPSDEEDVTVVDGKIKFKDRDNTNGIGYVILRKNKSFAEQVTKENTIYEIRYEFDLRGAEVAIPEGCVLKFEGGKINNGTIKGDNTAIESALLHIFSLDTNLKGKFSIDSIKPEWFGAIADYDIDTNIGTDNTSYIQKAIDVANVLNGGIIKFSFGRYLTNTLNISSPNIRLEGVGGMSMEGYSADTEYYLNGLYFKSTKGIILKDNSHNFQIENLNLTNNYNKNNILSSCINFEASDFISTFIFDKCHFKGFHKCFRVAGTTSGYAIGFLTIRDCGFIKNDFIVYGEDSDVNSNVHLKYMGINGLSFINNKCHANYAICRVGNCYGTMIFDSCNFESPNNQMLDGTTDDTYMFDIDSSFTCGFEMTRCYSESLQKGLLKFISRWGYMRVNVYENNLSSQLSNSYSYFEGNVVFLNMYFGTIPMTITTKDLNPFLMENTEYKITFDMNLANPFVSVANDCTISHINGLINGNISFNNAKLYPNYNPFESNNWNNSFPIGTVFIQNNKITHWTGTKWVDAIGADV